MAKCVRINKAENKTIQAINLKKNELLKDNKNYNTSVVAEIIIQEWMDIKYPNESKVIKVSS